ncbi:S8 family peptidase [Mechercharimyces sp. CAU 1602]|uniref:S8 family peptidase n=1 Tax=Mechercharimyces sp. CAU 1602 TaxID=2973933 RepID=UPI002162BA12|nr:S8 family peptidase [Mechercharimyces sp. CAU 1602]MCS1352026.1 S8 family peptidase [Mechercharimyces sp. CAU 1602]
MGLGKKVWFEEAGSRLDPELRGKLMEQRQQHHQHKSTDDTVPVIVQLSQKGDPQEVKKICQGDQCNRLEKELPLISSLSGRMEPSTIRRLTEHEGVNRIYYDREVHALLDVASKTIGSYQLQKAESLSGKGVTIAIVDTGIHPHADLVQPTSRILDFVDLVNGESEPYDDQGHGTHCAGDAAGNGFDSEELYCSPAPEASLIGIKVLDGNGSGRLSTVIKGVEWCVENREKHDIRVISMSLGANAYETYREDPLAQAVEIAWHHGMVVCAAAGNSGPYPGTISTPGIDPVIITVGSTDDFDTPERSDDERASYSSRGPTIDWLVKPDIYVPGTDIVSLSAPDSAIEKQLPENRVGKTYIRLSGTSMATPICAGVIALMLEANSYLSPNDVKTILKSSAQHMEGCQAGYIDAQAAVALAKKYLTFQEPAVPAT